MQLVLIGGAQRSGTTLLQTLLANALGARLLPEAHMLCDILMAYKRAKEQWRKTRFFYPTENDLLDFFRSFASRHVEDLARSAASPSILVLKDPNFVQVLAEATSLFPNAVRIVCVRDPRDIAASFLQIGQREPEKERPSRYTRRDVHFIAKKVLLSYAPLLETPEPANIVLVRYEELAAEPRATLEALSRDSRLELSYNRIDEPVWLAADARHDPAWVSELEGRKPSPDSVGAFKTVMELPEIKIVQQTCATLMERFGYDPVSTERPPPPTVAGRLRRFVKRKWRKYITGKPRARVKVGQE
jgi:Sulfotransferase family